MGDLWEVLAEKHLLVVRVTFCCKITKKLVYWAYCVWEV